jgi:hypothetical protein
MGLTRDFKETVRELAMAEPPFRRALLKESIELFSSGDFQTGKIVLRDYINATVGFQALGNALDLIPKSLMRMLSPSGNPHARTLFEIISFLQKEEGVSFTLQFRKSGVSASVGRQRALALARGTKNPRRPRTQPRRKIA